MSKITIDEYFTVIDKPKSAEIRIKGSRFIAHILNVESTKQAQFKYVNICREYHDARHNCFAFRITDSEYRYSDDGEPVGTAGKPIFQVIKGRNLYKVLIVVTRYFGGTKLGVGGLSRAYSDATIKALNNIKIVTETKYTSTNIQIMYDQHKELMQIISKFNGKIVKSNYYEKISLEVKIPQSKFANFQKEINYIIH